MILKKGRKGWGCSSGLDHLPGLYEALVPTPSHCRLNLKWKQVGEGARLAQLSWILPRYLWVSIEIVHYSKSASVNDESLRSSSIGSTPARSPTLLVTHSCVTSLAAALAPCSGMGYAVHDTPPSRSKNSCVGHIFYLSRLDNIWVSFSVLYCTRWSVQSESQVLSWSLQSGPPSPPE